MSIDWVTQSAPTWKRSWDRGLTELATPDLFGSQTPDIERTFRAKRLDEHTFKLGEQYNLRLDGGTVVVYDGVNRVAVSESPPSPIVKAIQESGFGHGIGVVREVYPHSGAADMLVS